MFPVILHGLRREHLQRSPNTEFGREWSWIIIKRIMSQCLVWVNILIRQKITNIVVNRHIILGSKYTKNAFAPAFYTRLCLSVYSASKTLAEFQNCTAGSTTWTKWERKGKEEKLRDIVQSLLTNCAIRKPFISIETPLILTQWRSINQARGPRPRTC